MIASLLLILAPINESYLIPSCQIQNINITSINRHKIVKLMNEQKSRQSMFLAKCISLKKDSVLVSETIPQYPKGFKDKNEYQNDPNNFNSESNNDQLYFLNEIDTKNQIKLINYLYILRIVLGQDYFQMKLIKLMRNLMRNFFIENLKRDQIEERNTDQNLLDNILEKIDKEENLNSISEFVTLTINDLQSIDNEIKIMKMNNHVATIDLHELEKLRRLVVQKDMCQKQLDNLKQNRKRQTHSEKEKIDSDEVESMNENEAEAKQTQNELQGGSPRKRNTDDRKPNYQSQNDMQGETHSEKEKIDSDEVESMNENEAEAKQTQNELYGGFFLKLKPNYQS